ncbi:TetR/AcrR family transcriptional regulator [Amycolatopsis sp. NPDC059657]|uniref:TetR/AcrR family transcriptional regulator n=1 Tax=Amycolatopsis sp. NPDC059657 TaxID=3346899 RepID=UPI003672E819
MTDDLPDQLRRLWGVPLESRLGRPAELDVARVVGAAVDLADRDGLAGVTLPKVAKELGVTPMSLYRYVGSKDELLVLMRDFAVGPAPEISPDAGWREGLTLWAYAELAVYQRRPWLPQVPVSGPPSGPNQIAWMESALRVLRDTGLAWPSKVGTLMLFSGYNRNHALLFQELGEDRVEEEQRYGMALMKLIDPERFPETAKLFASPTFQTPGDDYAFGLERLLDGTEAAIARAL